MPVHRTLSADGKTWEPTEEGEVARSPSAHYAADLGQRIIDGAKRAAVPCNGCRVCCINDAIILHPECGDDVASYETVPIAHPLTGRPAMMLKHKPNGECVYLGPGGCTIHARAPSICREYDCRRQYLSMTRAERRSAVSLGYMSKPQFDAGRQRVHTLAADEQAAVVASLPERSEHL